MPVIWVLSPVLALGLCLTVVGCGAPAVKEQPKHAKMPSAYIHRLDINKVQEGERVYAGIDALLVDENSYVWLNANAKTMLEEPSEPFLLIFRKGDEWNVVVHNQKTFKVAYDAPRGCTKLRVARVVIVERAEAAAKNATYEDYFGDKPKDTSAIARR